MTRLGPIEIDPSTLFHQHFALPALPGVVSQVQNLLYDENVDIKKVAELISGDPALVAQVIKVVNSAYYGLPREIVKVQSAIAFLGLNEVYRMVLCLSVINALAIKEKDEVDEFWFHSFYVALCTKYLAKKYEPYLSLEELWSAAMLHDIGKLVYLKFFPDHYKAVSSVCKKNGCLFSEAETHFSIPSSAFLGSLLCDHWRLPNKIRTACECHTLKNFLEIKKESPSAVFRRVVCMGNLLTVLSTEALNDDTRHRIATAIGTALHHTEEEFLAMMGDVYELKIEVERFAGQLS